MTGVMVPGAMRTPLGDVSDERKAQRREMLREAEERAAREAEEQRRFDDSAVKAAEFLAQQIGNRLQGFVTRFAHLDARDIFTELRKRLPPTPGSGR